MFFKELSEDAKIDDPLVPPVGADGENFKISNGKVRLVIYHWEDLFRTKILAKVVLSGDDY